jgi:hypothetical protein
LRFDIPCVKTWARASAVIAVAVAAWALAAWWPKARNEFFVLLGSRNESGGWYGFHSGVGGSLYLSLVPAAFLVWYHRTCHASPLCLRWGKYEAAGGVFRLCRRHHPDMEGQRPHQDMVREMHEAWREGRR